jgi:hypothetical protein
MLRNTDSNSNSNDVGISNSNSSRNSISISIGTTTRARARTRTSKSISVSTSHRCHSHINALLCPDLASHHLHQKSVWSLQHFYTSPQMRTVGIVLRRMIMNAIIAWLLWKCLAGLTVVFILVLGVDIIANTVAPSNNATRHAVQMIRVCEVGLIRVMASIASETYLTMSRSIVEPPPPAR